MTHHDALEFPDGEVVLVSRLCEGQRATVLQLPAGVACRNCGGDRRRTAASRILVFDLIAQTDTR